MPASTEHAAPPVPRRAWWRRIVRWMFLLGVLLLLMVVGGGWWAWKNQSTVMRFLLKQLPGGSEAVMGDFKAGINGVTITDLVLKERKSDRELVRVGTLHWNPDWRQLSVGEMGHLEVQDAVVHLEDAGEGPKTQSSSSGGGLPDVKFASLKVMNAHVISPWGTVRIDQEAKGIHLASSVAPSVESFATTVRELSEPTGGVSVKSIKAEGSLSGEAGRLTLETVMVDGVRAQPGPDLIAKLDEWMQPSGTASDSGGAVSEVVIKSVSISDVSGSYAGVKGQLSAELRDIGVLPGKAPTGKLEKLVLRELEVSPPSGKGQLRVMGVEANAELTSDGIQVSKLVINQSEIEWTPDLEEWLLPESSESAGSPGANLPRLEVKALDMINARLQVRRTPTVGYDGAATVNLQLRDLVRSVDGSINSTERQVLTVTEVELAQHPTDREKPLEPFLKLQEAKLAVVLDDWRTEQKIDTLWLKKPEVQVLPETVFAEGRVAKKMETRNEPVAEPIWKKISFDHLDVTGGAVAYSDVSGRRMDFSSAVDIDTTGGNTKIHLSKVMLHAPELSPSPLTNIGEIVATVCLPEVWKTQQVDELKVIGGEVDFNDALKKILASDVASGAEPANKTKGTADMPWRVGRAVVADTFVTLHNLFPGLQTIKLAVGYDMNDLPLAPDALVGNLKPQKLELGQISLRSPHDPLREVLEMNTIFVHFTLDGLMKQQIEKVEIIQPTLYVGEDLFDYIAYYRKYAAGELPPDAPGPAMVAADDLVALKTAQQMRMAAEKPGPGWTLDTLAVAGGKLVVAPKGIPLAGIPRPFPFNLVTKLEGGQIEAELVVPSDTYTWEKLKLEFENLHGKVLFNLPFKNFSNNLTETFEVDRIRYKQLHMEDCHLSVTYDAKGIYGSFGGAAYGGYINGAVNIYNDHAYTWDGWITGSGVTTTEITQKLCPTWMLLEGKVDAEVIALGDGDEIYQTDIKFKGEQPGNFSVTTLDSAIESIPKDIPGYLQDITRIGIETVRDFPYETAEAKARFYGREGTGYLRLKGPLGTRNVEINVYDRRWQKDKAAPQTSSATLHVSP